VLCALRVVSPGGHAVVPIMQLEVRDEAMGLREVERELFLVALVLLDVAPFQPASGTPGAREPRAEVCKCRPRWRVVGLVAGMTTATAFRIRRHAVMLGAPGSEQRSKS